MKNIFFCILIVFIISCKTTSPHNTAQNGILFNGKDLNGWTIHGNQKWYVENGVIISENSAIKEFGYLSTNNVYKNFELTLEFKKEPKSNGGVFIHADVKNTTIKGWQVEIAVPTHFTGGIHEYERGWLVKPKLEKDKVVKLDTWNTMKVLVKDNTLTTWINGTEMATITDEKLGITTGKIALQIHKGKTNTLQWRNIIIKEL